MFRSARLKLTLFYLAVIAVFSLTVTLSIRVVAEHEYMRSNSVTRSELRQQVWVQSFRLRGERPEVIFADIQSGEAALFRQHLNQALLWVNLFALTIGGLISYWFATRTLRPIQEAHDAQARFAADASHELRTPLTNMRLENEVFLRQKKFNEGDARELIASNLEEIQRLEGLSSNLLALAQYGRTKLDVRPLPIHKVVDAAVASLAKNLKAKDVHINTVVAPAKVFGHESSLIQLLGIILDNAVKYGPAKGAITIGGKQKGSQYVLSISDEGPGIPESDLPHIFDRLYRGDKARSSTVPGYGLGLALAQEIAQANRAHITASNTPGGKGAVFTLALEVTRNNT